MTERSPSEKQRDRNEDPEKLGGAVAGATGVGVGGAIGLAALGPLGAVIGALAGAAGGWWAGRELIETVNDIDRDENRLRRAYEHAGATQPYEEVRHGFQLGYIAGRNPEYAGSDFADVETDLRTAWTHAHRQDEHPVPWEDVRDQARTGYQTARSER